MRRDSLRPGHQRRKHNHSDPKLVLIIKCVPEQARRGYSKLVDDLYHYQILTRFCVYQNMVVNMRLPMNKQELPSRERCEEMMNVNYKQSVKFSKHRLGINMQNVMRDMT